MYMHCQWSNCMAPRTCTVSINQIVLTTSGLSNFPSNHTQTDYRSNNLRSNRDMKHLGLLICIIMYSNCYFCLYPSFTVVWVGCLWNAQDSLKQGKILSSGWRLLSSTWGFPSDLVAAEFGVHWLDVSKLEPHLSTWAQVRLIGIYPYGYPYNLIMLYWICAVLLVSVSNCKL